MPSERLGQHHPALQADAIDYGGGLPADAVPHFLDRLAIGDDKAARLEHLNRPGGGNRLAGSNAGAWLQPASSGEPSPADATADGPTHNADLRVLGLPAGSIHVELLGPPVRPHPR